MPGINAPKKVFYSFVICYECKGSGTLFKNEFKGHTQGYEATPYVCPVCKGHRVLKRKVTIEFLTI